MKKILITLIAVIAIGSFSQAQVLQQGDNAINFGIGIPRLYDGGKISLPAIVASYEHGFTKKIGIGYIGGGIEMAIAGSHEDFYNVKYKNTYFIVGPRAAYHFAFGEMSNSSAFNKLDIYAGVFLGVNINSYKVDPDPLNVSDSDVSFHEDVFVGARYSFTDNIGVYVEAGYNVSYLNGGICLRF